jgi:hypothetical protein
VKDYKSFVGRANVEDGAIITERDWGWGPAWASYDKGFNGSAGNGNIDAQDGQSGNPVLDVVFFLGIGWYKQVESGGLVIDISNTPSSHDFGIVQPSQTYWSNGAEPGWPLGASDCWGSLTNNSSFAVNILASMTNMAGGTTWSIGSSPGTNVFTLKIGIAGTANIGNFTTLSNTPVAWITSMAAGNMTRWTFVFYAPTGTSYSDPAEHSGNITLAAEAS